MLKVDTNETMTLH